MVFLPELPFLGNCRFSALRADSDMIFHLAQSAHVEFEDQPRRRLAEPSLVHQIVGFKLSVVDEGS